MSEDLLSIDNQYLVDSFVGKKTKNAELIYLKKINFLKSQK